MLPENTSTFSFTTLFTQIWKSINCEADLTSLKGFNAIRILLTRPDAPLPLEGGGTIWQLSDGTVEESRTVENYSRFEECKAKEIINSPLSGVRVMKSDLNDCSQQAEAATWLSSWRE